MSEMRIEVPRDADGAARIHQPCAVAHASAAAARQHSSPIITKNLLHTHTATCQASAFAEASLVSVIRQHLRSRIFQFFWHGCERRVREGAERRVPHITRTHHVPKSFWTQLLQQHTVSRIVRDGSLIAEWNTSSASPVLSLAGSSWGQPIGGGCNVLREHCPRGNASFTVELNGHLRPALAGPNKTLKAPLLDCRDASGSGVAIFAVEDGSKAKPVVALSSGAANQQASGDSESWHAGGRNSIAVVVDGAAQLITFVTNGVLADGGQPRKQGWTALSQELGSVAGARRCAAGAGVESVRVYSRALMTTELVGMWRAGAE